MSNTAAANTNASADSSSSTSNAAQPYHSASLYVGDLHLDVTEALLFEVFSAAGTVASIRVCRDAVTRRSLGYAYVNFHNFTDAERALDTMNFTNIKSCPCRLMWSQRDPSLRKSGVGNIFVKNLDVSIDNKALYDTFSLFGNILSCKVVIDADGNSKGYGYVHYETAEAANESIAKINGMLIAGQEVYVGHFQKKQDRPDATHWTNCYVKNIPKHWTDNDLMQQFSPFGEVSSCVVMKGGVAPDNKGFGFVDFDDPEAAHKAVEMLNGKKVQSEDGTEEELYVGKAQKKSERERELRSKFESLKIDRINKYQGVNLYVKNLDDTVTEDDLRDAFATQGTITSTRIMKDANSVPKGFGFVCFSSPEEATKAVTEMSGKLLNGKPMFVALAQRKEVRRAQLEAQHAQQRAGGMGGRGMPLAQPPMYGAAPMFYAQPNQIPPQARQGFVYPQQMMPRGVPRGPMGAYGRGPAGAYQMPAYGMPMQGRQQRRPRQSGPGGRGMNMPRGLSPQNRNFKYTTNARNQPQRDGMPMPQAPGVAAPPTPTDALTPAALAAASAEQQKTMIGERLYPLIHAQQPELAGKITGMLLEMDNGELLHLLESPDALAAKIAEAVAVLDAHSAVDGEATQE